EAYWNPKSKSTAELMGSATFVPFFEWRRLQATFANASETLSGADSDVVMLRAETLEILPEQGGTHRFEAVEYVGNGFLHRLRLGGNCQVPIWHPVRLPLDRGYALRLRRQPCVVPAS